MHNDLGAGRDSSDGSTMEREHRVQQGSGAEASYQAVSWSPGVSATPTILVVDDDEPTAESIEMVLQEAGYAVTRAANGQEALAAARTHWPILLVTDQMMPGMSGVALVEAMREMAEAEERPMPPVLLLTAAYRPPHVEDGRISVVLGKPFDVEKLENTVARLLGEAQGE